MGTEISIKPLVLNLLVEEQLTERQNARDPFKMILVLAIVVITLAVGAGTFLGMRADRKKTELVGLKQQLHKLTAAPADSDTGTLKATRSFCDEIKAMNEKRALFAPQLGLIKEIIPDTIQLTRVTTGIATETRETAAPTPGPVDKDRPRRPTAVTIDYVTLMLDGRAISMRPEIEVDDFLKAMRADTRFADKVKEIQLRSIAPAPVVATAGKTGPTVGAAAFVIDCRYKELVK